MHCSVIVCYRVGSAVDAVYMIVSGGRMSPVVRHITREHLDTLYKFKRVSPVGYLRSGQAKPGELIIHGLGLRQIVEMYGHWRTGQLRTLARCHGIRIPARNSHTEIVETLRDHACDSCNCSDVEYIFQMLSTVRRPAPERNTALNEEIELQPNHVEQTSDDTQGSLDNAPYLEVADACLRDAIVTEWEQVMSTSALMDWVCAVCARCTPQAKIIYVKPSKINFALLRNDALPDQVRPTSYNLQAYDGALLHPKGLTNSQARADMRVCNEC